MLDFAQAQARLGTSIDRCMGNATLQLAVGVVVPGTFTRRPRGDEAARGFGAVASDAEFSASTAALGPLELQDARVSITHRGQVSLWRVSSAHPDHDTLRTRLVLEVQR